MISGNIELSIEEGDGKHWYRAFLKIRRTIGIRSCANQIAVAHRCRGNLRLIFAMKTWIKNVFRLPEQIETAYSETFLNALMILPTIDFEKKKTAPPRDKNHKE